jgi:Zn-dependent protease
MNEGILVAFQFVVLIFSVMIHEISHGLVAERLGDPTARDAGRLTMNPLKHIDPFGSILLPLLLVVTHAPFVIGWAKPVPYDPRYLKNPKWGAAQIAAAGPASNFGIAIVLAIILRVLPASVPSYEAFSFFVSVIIFMNILLVVFNLIPIPPLDGSKVLYALLPETQTGYAITDFLERYGFAILIAFLLWGMGILSKITGVLYMTLTGATF